jgi:hypothetical protein
MSLLGIELQQPAPYAACCSVVTIPQFSKKYYESDYSPPKFGFINYKNIGDSAKEPQKKYSRWSQAIREPFIWVTLNCSTGIDDSPCEPHLHFTFHHLRHQIHSKTECYILLFLVTL